MISKRITSAAAVAPLAALLATLGPAPARARLLLETAAYTVAPAGTEMPCAYVSALEQSGQAHSTRSCDDNQELRCNYRTCDEDNHTLTEKCIVPSGWRATEELPEGTECEILTPEGGGTPQALGGARPEPTLPISTVLCLCHEHCITNSNISCYQSSLYGSLPCCHKRQ